METFEIAPGYVITRVIKGGWQLAGGHGSIDSARAIAEMAAFYDETRQPSPGAGGWLAFAPIPGNVCGQGQ